MNPSGSPERHERSSENDPLGRRLKNLEKINGRGTFHSVAAWLRHRGDVQSLRNDRINHSLRGFADRRWQLASVAVMLVVLFGFFLPLEENDRLGALLAWRSTLEPEAMSDILGAASIPSATLTHVPAGGDTTRYVLPLYDAQLEDVASWRGILVGRPDVTGVEHVEIEEKASRSLIERFVKDAPASLGRSTSIPTWAPPEYRLALTNVLRFYRLSHPHLCRWLDVACGGSGSGQSGTTGVGYSMGRFDWGYDAAKDSSWSHLGRAYSDEVKRLFSATNNIRGAIRNLEYQVVQERSSERVTDAIRLLNAEADSLEASLYEQAPDFDKYAAF